MKWTLQNCFCFPTYICTHTFPSHCHNCIWNTGGPCKNLMNNWVCEEYLGLPDPALAAASESLGNWSFPVPGGGWDAAGVNRSCKCPFILPLVVIAPNSSLSPVWNKSSTPRAAEGPMRSSKHTERTEVQFPRNRAESGPPVHLRPFLRPASHVDFSLYF